MKNRKAFWENNSKWKTLVRILSFVVVFCTSYALILPAITLASEPFCGLEEHEHNSECYEETLVCENEEEEHVHDATCYQEKLVCGLEEHKHSDICFSDRTADVVQDFNTKVDITKDIRKNIVNVAVNEIGYEASTKNYDIVDGQKLGYTKYGAWYNEDTKYEAKWDTLFTSYVLDQALVNVRSEKDTGKLQKHFVDLGQYENASYKPEAGDVLFFTEDDLKSGIVKEVSDSQMVIIREENKKIVQKNVSLTDSRITGYGITVKKQEPVVKENTETKEEVKKEEAPEEDSEEADR
ncbi:MAG: CHAP domain-containing protein, partial [Firmicutes bacterium]|nr:CHAP domain-containing protein [Bacillota bacterium]